MKYEMKLHNEPFNLINSGSKTIELRLNDPKRQLLKVGDTIEFTNIDTAEKLLVEIVDLVKYPSFLELYKDNDKVAMGYALDEEANYKDMELYYSLEEQKKYGVLAIKIKKL